MSRAPTEPFDVAVIGAGVVGCALARRATLAGARVVILERGRDILSGASKGNSAMLHTGFDAPTGSLELACMQAGHREYREICDRLNLPLLETGALVIAWNAAEADRLDAIVAQAHGNGVGDAQRLTREETLAREPALAPDFHGAVLVPGECLIDPWSAPLAYVLQAIVNGAVLLRNAEVRGGYFTGDHWRLDTTQGSIMARFVFNCAGLYGDWLDRDLLGSAAFTIRPRKGQFVVFDKAAARVFRSIILPVPSERTKGITLSRTVFGNVLVGPTAEEQPERDVATVDGAQLRALIQYAERVFPALTGMPVTAIYAGLRPATESKEYCIIARPERRWITVGGIRSTGLTAALGIATHVIELYQDAGGVNQPLAEPLWPTVPNLAEHRERDWQRPGGGEIVCHCEWVTRREIEAALAGLAPATDLGGLKRRTRATLGRCQGFHCLGRIAALTQGRFDLPVAVGAAHG
ncbi:MAG: NAD(P)/FAD-dependent oxidoreductase [Gammaproteobacteria bacterium]